MNLPTPTLDCIARHRAALLATGVTANAHNVAMRSGFEMHIVRRALALLS